MQEGHYAVVCEHEFDYLTCDFYWVIVLTSASNVGRAKQEITRFPSTTSDEYEPAKQSDAYSYCYTPYTLNKDVKSPFTHR